MTKFVFVLTLDYKCEKRKNVGKLRGWAIGKVFTSSLRTPQKGQKNQRKSFHTTCGQKRTIFTSMVYGLTSVCGVVFAADIWFPQCSIFVLFETRSSIRRPRSPGFGLIVRGRNAPGKWNRSGYFFIFVSYFESFFLLQQAGAGSTGSRVDPKSRAS